MKTKKSEVKPVEVIMTMVVVSIIVFVSLIAFQGKTQTASKSINFIVVPFILAVLIVFCKD